MNFIKFSIIVVIISTQINKKMVGHTDFRFLQWLAREDLEGRHNEHEGEAAAGGEHQEGLEGANLEGHEEAIHLEEHEENIHQNAEQLQHQEELALPPLPETSDDEDEGITLDCSDDLANLEMAVQTKMVSVASFMPLNRKIFCTSYYYVDVKTRGKGYYLCLRCYLCYINANVQAEGAQHRHVEGHITTTFDPRCRIHCSSCRLPLRQVKAIQSCLWCNGTMKRQK